MPSYSSEVSAIRLRPIRVWLSHLQSIQLAIWTLILALFLLGYPRQMFAASLQAFQLWWQVLFPLFLPYFIVTGIVPLYKLGIFSTWFTASTVIAEPITQARRLGLLTRQQAEHKLAFAHATPLITIWILTLAVWHQPQYLFSLVASQVCAQLVMLFSLHKTALTRLPITLTSTQSLGQLLSESVRKAVQHLFQLAGWMMVAAIAWMFADLSGAWTVLPDAIPSFFLLSLLDLPLGVAMLAQSAIPPAHVPITVSLCSAAIGWGSLTGLLRVQAYLHGTDIRFTRLVVAKLIHAALSFIICLAINHYI
ncbi:MAG: hypothetical protein RLZZ267_1435 [Bacillota bacterium]